MTAERLYFLQACRQDRRRHIDLQKLFFSSFSILIFVIELFFQIYFTKLIIQQRVQGQGLRNTKTGGDFVESAKWLADDIDLNNIK